VRAAVLGAVGEPLSIEEVTGGNPGPGEVLVRVTASGVCHSDLSVCNGTLPLQLPAILGHEGTGVVEWAGREVTRVRPGDRVIGSFLPACGRCRQCLADRSHLCEEAGRLLGRACGTRADGTALYPMTGLGTFAETMVCEELSVVPVGTDLPDEVLALIGCGVTTGVGAALNTAAVRPGSTVAVVGCGGVGQAVIQGAKIAGASRIIAVDPVAYKRETALRLGATDALDPSDSGTGTVEGVRELTDGVGVDYAFEVIGNVATIREAFSMTASGGSCIVVGVPSAALDVAVPAAELIFGEKRLLGCLYGSAQVRRDFPRLVRMVERGQLDVGAMVSRRITLDEVNGAFDAMAAGTVIRSVIVNA